MPSRRMPGPRAEPPLGRRYWAAYFDAIATGELLLKPHTARRRAGEVAPQLPLRGRRRCRACEGEGGDQSSSHNGCAPAHPRGDAASCRSLTV